MMRNVESIKRKREHRTSEKNFLEFPQSLPSREPVWMKNGKISYSLSRKMHCISKLSSHSLQHLFKSRTIVVSHLRNESKLKWKISQDLRATSCSFEQRLAVYACIPSFCCSRIPNGSYNEMSSMRTKKTRTQSKAMKKHKAHTFRVLNLISHLILVSPTISLNIRKEHSFSFSARRLRGCERTFFLHKVSFSRERA